MQHTVPNSTKIIWITQSPTEQNFVETQDNLEIRYISRIKAKKELNIVDFSYIIEKEVMKLVNKIKYRLPKYIVAIEAPEWEGLLSNYYRAESDKNILKITRIHTPLAVTAELNDLKLDEIKTLQMQKEHKQMLNSNILSAPTNYIYNLTQEKVLKNQGLGIPHIIVPNPIDVNHFSKINNTRAEAVDLFKKYTKCPINPDDFNIFIVGSVEKRKGVEIFIETIPLIINQIPNAHFYFIGHCKENSSSLTANNKFSAEGLLSRFDDKTKHHVHIAGYINHDLMPKIMQAGDLFLICYLGDNFPGVLIEVGLSKRPVIALLKGGIPEMVRDSGKNTLCLTINGNTINEIAKECVSKILEFYKAKEALNLTEHFYQHLLKEFSGTKIISTLKAFYKSRIDSNLSLAK
ncbi:glycosyltransferase family 4 protein [Wolbachia endosymbiont of Oedothorax gibbosus]|uniref:glycosyltransferase family 4 protein n=1 Tax=Wolbachia endosymbiont of Oedothorax gibbosus TaxID=931100 RepID=UPI0020259034|nr:glycosyltransferase family 4 protein [Wolbachia endosymbiont of Oedothorax gibbosus]